MGLFGQGTDTFNQAFGQGINASQGQLGFGQFGLDASALPFELQAALLSGGGAHGKSLAGLYGQKAQAGGSLFGGIGKALGGLFSDARLKDNLTVIGRLGELDWYEWDWNDKAREVGADTQPPYGVIAQDVANVLPEAVSTERGYLKVDYSMLVGA
jgi:hypothetical protein